MKACKFYVLLLAMTAAIPSWAGGGSEVGGGGNNSSGRFISRVWNVIERIEATKQNEVNLDILKDTLQNPLFKIKVVKRLKNPKTGIPIRNQELNAYSSPLLIQLRESTIQGILNAHDNDYFFLHELLIASGRYSDRAFQLSIGKLRLDRPRPKIMICDLYSYIPAEATCVRGHETQTVCSRNGVCSRVCSFGPCYQQWECDEYSHSPAREVIIERDSKSCSKGQSIIRNIRMIGD